MSKVERRPTENPTLRLCYVSGPWAYFTPHDPTEVCGDDWDDAPYEHNAEPPYEQFGAVCVAWRGAMDAPSEGHLNSPWSVDDINRGAAPWLVTASWRRSEPRTEIPAGVTLAEFIALVRRDGGEVYLPAPTTPPTPKEGA